ncbi:MAG: universal stress protein [Polyangiales bacterium]
MPVWKTLLVPTDFSEGARVALRLAADVAREHGARVVLLHVAELLPGITPETVIQPEGAATPMRVEDFTRTQAQGWMDQDRAIAAAGLEVATDVVLGPTVQSILDAAARHAADLIVMGTHGRAGLAHLMLGSVTERVVRQSTVPVLTVRAPKA